MSSSDRRRFLAALSAPMLLSACFRPLLAENSAGDEVLGNIELPKITDRFSYHLHERLEDRLGRPDTVKYRLVITTNLRERGLAVTQDNETTRRRLTAVADWSLFAIGKPDPILKERTLTQSGFDSTSSLFAERSTRQDVERRLAEDLGERIAREILARAPVITQKAGS